jgi:hypothetical protein
MNQLIRIENQELAIVGQQFQLLTLLTFDSAKERVYRLVERNSSFFQTLLSIHFPMDGELIEELLPKLALGSTHYSFYNEGTKRVEYAKLGLTFNMNISFQDSWVQSSLLQNSLTLQIGDEAVLCKLPLDLGLEREYKIEANRAFAMRNQLDKETTNRYFDFEEEILRVKSGRNGYSLTQLEKIEFKYLMLYDESIYLNFKSYMTREFVLYFFKNLT